MNIVLSWLAFAVVAVASSRLAVFVTKFNFPMIFGYVVVGVFTGPYVLNLIPLESLPGLKWVTQTAVAYIAFSAGAELYLPELRALFKRIVTVTTVMAGITFIFVSIVWWLLAKYAIISWAAPFATGCQYSMGMIAASIMVERSPAAVLAVVKESRAKGAFTSTVLGVTVFCDVYVLVMFTFTSNLAHTYCSESPFNALALIVSLSNIVGAVLLGWVVGQILIVLLWAKHPFWQYLIPPLGFGLFQAAEEFLHYSLHHWELPVNLDPLLICIVAGYIATNQSRNRRKFLSFLSTVCPYIFIPFFTLVGNSINLALIANSMSFAPIIVAVRAVAILVGTWIGGTATGMPKDHKNVLWLSLISQAGLSLGLAAEVAADFDDFGRDMQTALVSIILLNLIIGPLLCKFAFFKSGEAGKGGGEEEEEEAHVKQAILVGVDGSSLGVGQKLLDLDWNVIFYDKSTDKLDRVLSVLQVPQFKFENPVDTVVKTLNAFTPKAIANAVTGIVTGQQKEEEKAALKAPDSPADHSARVLRSSSIPTPHPLAEIAAQVSGGIDAQPVAADESAVAAHAADENEVQLDTRYLDVTQDIAAAFEAESEDIPMGSTHVAVVNLPDDLEACTLACFLHYRLAVPRIIVRIRNPAWANQLTALGMIVVHDSALLSNYLEQLVVSEHSPCITIPAGQSLHDGAKSLLDGELKQQFSVAHLSEMAKHDFASKHPGPSSDFFTEMEKKFKAKDINAFDKSSISSMLSARYQVHHDVTQSEEKMMKELFVSASAQELRKTRDEEVNLQ